MADRLRARWYDGRSSQAQAVAVMLEAGPRGPKLLVQAAYADPLVFEHHQVGWPERWSERRAPRVLVVDLGPQGSLELDDAAGWQAALAAAGDRPPLAQRMQTRWTVFLAVAVVAVSAIFAFYRWGTPWAATHVTRQVPLDWETSLSQRALQDLDASWLKPSKLPTARQDELRARFDALARQVTPDLQRYGGYSPKLSLQFRSGMPANAFALPGGAIVMTDAMVEEAAKRKLGDDALVGVLAHEIGHVVHRHTTRMVVEQGVLNIGLGLALGDVSALVSFGGSLLTGLAYRRSHESEADCFALALMRRAQLPTGPMGELLLGIDGPPAAEAGEAAQRSGGEGWMTLLSSHPDTHGRALKLKEGRAEGC